MCNKENEKQLNLHLTEADWLKLRDFNVVIARKIKSRLPIDWDLSIEDIEGAVYDTFIRYLNSYKPGAMSPVSYCYQYAELATYRDLIREYKRLKKQYDIDDLYGEDSDDDQPCKHKYGHAEVQALSVDDRQKLAKHIEVDELLSKMPKIDQMIAELIMKGYSYDDIAKDLGIDRKTAMRRMKKYSK